MPEVELTLAENRIMLFNSTDYFVYPTRILGTAPVRSMFGIAAQFFNKDVNSRFSDD